MAEAMTYRHVDTTKGSERRANKNAVAASGHGV
jgi:hypothetical protein